MRAGNKILLVSVVLGTSVLILRGVLRSDRELPKDRAATTRPAPSVSSPSCSPAPAAVVPAALDTQALQATIRQIVREELQASREAGPRQSGLLPPQAAAPPAPSAESHEALKKA